ncbi:unnamed protein product [Choristocarpus tenellus]
MKKGAEKKDMRKKPGGMSGLLKVMVRQVMGPVGPQTSGVHLERKIESDIQVSSLGNAPDDIILTLSYWLNSYDLGVALTLSRQWFAVATCNQVWRPHYVRKFGDLPNCDGNDDSELKHRYRERLVAPLVGDHVQVAWVGKFRLDTSNFYIGVSWWDAKVIAMDSSDVESMNQEAIGNFRERAVRSHLRYKVHFHSWGNEWDQWVRPEFIRWRTNALGVGTGMDLAPGDRAEFYCCGELVGGSWLEAKVVKVSETAICLSQVVLTSKRVWVSKNMVRSRSASPKTIAALARSVQQCYTRGGKDSLRREQGCCLQTKRGCCVM